MSEYRERQVCQRYFRKTYTLYINIHFHRHFCECIDVRHHGFRFTFKDNFNDNNLFSFHHGDMFHLAIPFLYIFPPADYHQFHLDVRLVGSHFCRRDFPRKRDVPHLRKAIVLLPYQTLRRIDRHTSL